MFGMMGDAMMGIGYGGYGYGFGFLGLIGWLWAVIWTVNSVLIGVLLWKLIEKYTKK